MLPRAVVALLASVALTSATPVRRCGRASTATTTAAATAVTPSSTVAASEASASSAAASSADATSAVVSSAAVSSAAVSAASSSGTATIPTKVAVTPALPTTGATDLPLPGNLTLLNIAVGHGIQNYTCTGAGVAATAVGALAVLYDITPFYPGMSSDAVTQDVFDAIPHQVLWTTDLPLNLVNKSIGTAPGLESRNTAAYATEFPPFLAASDISISSVSAPLKFLGHHFFDAAGIPTFDLSAASPSATYFQGKKDNGVKAPTSADSGILSTGAVDWLKLGEKGLGTSKGVSLLYRVVTAGGNAQTCNAAGDTGSVPYTAQYWFYG